ncbi:hypothetical protein O1M63_49750 [Streptomyces mirabilis]|nr:hypothetical protein [Streptomyces mirabilis]
MWIGQDALAGIAELANIAAAAGADEVVLAWETHDVATACELPIVGPAPCLNMVLASRDRHVLHQFPTPSSSCPAAPRAGRRSPRLEAPAPQPGGELVPPIQTAATGPPLPHQLGRPRAVH